MNITAEIKKLCTPAYVYLVMSVIAIIILMFQNAGNNNKLCVGLYECDVPNTSLLFLVKGLYVVFWTYVLNLLCKYGYSSVSWFFVLFPFILFFILLGMVMINQGVKRI